MRANGLLSPKPVRPFIGYSVTEITTIVQNFRSPAVRNNGFSYEHRFPLDTFLDLIVCDFANSIFRLALGDYQ